MASESMTLSIADPEGRQAVRLSSPNRVIWPDAAGGAGITKAELAEYIRSVAVPFLSANGDRPVSLERFRSGIGPEAESFFSKNPPKGTPDFVDTVEVTYNSGRRHPQIVLNRPSAIVWAVQMNTIVFHPWASLSEDPDRPVELRIDVDPQPGTGFGDAVRAARGMREVGPLPRMMDTWLWTTLHLSA